VTEPFRGSVLEATLERITFANADTGYTVARVDAGHVERIANGMTSTKVGN
jgi:exodeoxyribonuclease V alpha subunit